MVVRKALAFLAMLFVGYIGLLFIAVFVDASNSPPYFKEATIALAAGIIAGIVYAFLNEFIKDFEVKTMSTTSRFKNGCLWTVTLDVLCIILGGAVLWIAPTVPTLSPPGFFLMSFGTAFFISGLNCYRFDEIEGKLDAMRPKP